MERDSAIAPVSEGHLGPGSKSKLFMTLLWQMKRSQRACYLDFNICVHVSFWGFFLFIYLKTGVLSYNVFPVRSSFVVPFLTHSFFAIFCSCCVSSVAPLSTVLVTVCFSQFFSDSLSGWISSFSQIYSFDSILLIRLKKEILSEWKCFLKEPEWFYIRDFVREGTVIFQTTDSPTVVLASPLMVFLDIVDPLQICVFTEYWLM